MSNVNIEGINKVQLLKALWLKSSPASFFSNGLISPPSFDDRTAEAAVLQYIDYFCGRCIKCDLTTNEVDPYLYDRDFGTGAFARVVASLRS